MLLLLVGLDELRLGWAIAKSYLTGWVRNTQP